MGGVVVGVGDHPGCDVAQFHVQLLGGLGHHRESVVRTAMVTFQEDAFAVAITSRVCTAVRSCACRRDPARALPRERQRLPGHVGVGVERCQLGGVELPAVLYETWWLALGLAAAVDPAAVDPY